MKTLLLIALLILPGCGTTGVTRMSPEQIKATAGLAICDDGDAMYPGAAARGTTIMVNVDDVRKGATSQGKIVITCGKSTMTIETSVGVGPTAVPSR